MGGVVICRALSRGRVIQLFILGRTCNAIILNSRERPVLAARQVRLHVVKIQIEADVTIKVAVPSITGVSLVPAPDLFCRFQVPTKSRDAIGREDRCEYRVTRPRASMQDSMGFQHEPSKARLRQGVLDGLTVSTLRKP